jgi:hypothetical protein
MNCQTNPKTGISQSQTLPGSIGLDAGAHFFNTPCNANRKRTSAIRVNQSMTISANVGSGWLCIFFLKCQMMNPESLPDSLSWSYDRLTGNYYFSNVPFAHYPAICRPGRTQPWGGLVVFEQVPDS